MAMSETQQTVLATIETWVREKLEVGNSVAHGWLHTDRVRHHIRTLAPAEGVDLLLAELAALLHDVGRTQPGPEDEHGARSAALAEPLLAGLPLSEGDREAVLHAVRWHNSQRADTALLRVLRDADMLDGLGAVGIMRAFMSKSHLAPYDPAAPFEVDGDPWSLATCSDQIHAQRTWLNRFNTEAARQMAQDRAAFMDAFLDQVRGELPATGDGRTMTDLHQTRR
jgi:uncharacterized protein